MSNQQVVPPAQTLHESEKAHSHEVELEKHADGQHFNRMHSKDILDAAAKHGYVTVAGRLVIDPKEAEIEFGPEVASRLKLSKDGTKVLWPQPTDDPNVGHFPA